MNIDQEKRINFENPTEEQKELIRYWIEKFAHEAITEDSVHKDRFIESYLSSKPKIEVGKWYVDHNDDGEYLFNHQDNDESYGFFRGQWQDGAWQTKDWDGPNLREATEQEVTERLIEEAKRRGYKPGNFKCLYMPHQEPANLTGDFYSEWTESDGVLIWMGNEEDDILCYEKGKWAEIIPDKKLPAPSELEDAIKALDNATEKLKNLLK